MGDTTHTPRAYAARVEMRRGVIPHMLPEPGEPEVFARRAAQSRRLGVNLVRVKNKRIPLDELDPNAKGRPLKSLKMPECGLFCEEQLPLARRAA